MKSTPLSLLCAMFITLYSNAQTYTSQQVVNGISSPTAFAFADANLIFVTEKAGKLRVVKNNALLAKAAIALSVSTESERGLIGVAIDPDFANNKLVYIYYTVSGTPKFNRIERYKYEADTLTLSSKQTVLELDQLSAGNHNGGALNFGPDGKLYIGVGENAVGTNAQNLDNYLGKILRVNSDGSVPTGNPFTGSAAKSRIWAYGLRNPYTFTFDPVSEKLFINDVGQGTWEEINDGTTAGLNFGWPTKEGKCTSSCTGFTDPLYSYGHGDGVNLGCSIIGGTFFNPLTTNYSTNLKGKYFYTDYCGDWINYIDPTNPATSTNFLTNLPDGITYLLTGPDGNLYFLSRTNNALYKITSDNVTSLEDSQFDTNINVYPNPTSGIIKVEYNKEFTTIIITDHLGREVYKTGSLNDNKEIDISHLTPGFYFLQSGESKTKLIKY